VYPEGGPDFETKYKWNAFEKLMIPSNCLHLINYELSKILKKIGITFLKKEFENSKPPPLPSGCAHAS